MCLSTIDNESAMQARETRKRFVSAKECSTKKSVRSIEFV